MKLTEIRNSIKNYNDLLSEVSANFNQKFAAIASPTLSKQETVTALHQCITAGVACGCPKLPFPWRRLIEFVPRLILMFAGVIYASMRFRVRHLPEGAVVFRTWLVPRSFKGSELVDDFFRQLPKDLVQYEKVVVSFTTTDIALLNQFGRAQKDENQIFSYGLLSPLDVLKLLFDYIFTALIQVKKKYFLDGVDVTAYINRSLLLDYLCLRSFEAYAEKYKCQKLIHYKINSFVYVFENQSWEKACCATFKGHEIRLIGYQSSGFSPIFLNFFPTLVDAHHQPMPDILLTVGDHFRRYLLEHGHYKIPVMSFAALRFSYPNIGGRYVVLPPNPRILGKILYAFPVQIEQYVGTINDLIEVFRGSSIFVDLKLHPLYRLSDFKDIFKLPDNFRVMNEIGINSIRDTYDFVLFNDNSFGIEALMNGVRSYQYSRDGSFSDDRFMYFDLWQVNYQLYDIVNLKNRIESGLYNKDFNVEYVSEYINAMYRPYTSDSLNRFRAMLTPTNSL